MDNQLFYYLYLLTKLHQIIKKSSGGTTMFTPEMDYMVYQEQHRDRLRKIEHQRLLQIAGQRQNNSPKLYRQSVSWLGSQLVKWGSQLQRYAAPDTGCQESSLKIPMMPKV